MQNAFVAAVPAFQSNRLACSACGNAMEGPLAPHLCAICGMPQPVRAEEDYFTALNVERRFGQDSKALERRFYELSRALHPDRFQALGASHGLAKKLSLERMSFLNEAYRTLRTPEAMREYILERAGYKKGTSSGGAGALPLEIAEAWFELQEGLIEDRVASLPKLAEFEQMLETRELKLLSNVQETERGYDLSQAPELLQKLAQMLQSIHYFRSLKRDIMKYRERHD